MDLRTIPTNLPLNYMDQGLTAAVVHEAYEAGLPVRQLADPNIGQLVSYCHNQGGTELVKVGVAQLNQAPQNAAPIKYMLETCMNSNVPIEQLQNQNSVDAITELVGSHDAQGAQAAAHVIAIAPDYWNNQPAEAAGVLSEWLGSGAQGYDVEQLEAMIAIKYSRDSALNLNPTEPQPLINKKNIDRLVSSSRYKAMDQSAKAKLYTGDVSDLWFNMDK